jgi:NAD(P)-dependent dehydrogenase (short-subunit alcohol dehydrogenase family)
MAALNGQHAVVTGGGRGIGRAIAAALSGAGVFVTVVGRQERCLADAVSSGHARAYLVADVTDRQGLLDGLKRHGDQHGAIGILVANAGGAESSPFAKTDPDLFRRMFELNVMGVVNAVQAVLPGMTDRGSGRIVAIASTAGLKGYPYVTAYCAAKHAVIGLVRALAVETAKSGITVNAVCPGYTDTDLFTDSIAQIAAKTGRSRDDIIAAMLQQNPLGRLVQPKEVAAAVLFLCSPAAASITGTTLAVAGGEV